jgi:hypothetical protein
MKHAFEIGLASNTGANNNGAILTEDKVREIKILLKTNTTEQVLQLFGWDKSKRHLIANIKCGRVWRSVVAE